MRFSCRKYIKLTYINNKLRELQAAGVDIDRLPNDLTLAAILALNHEDALHLTGQSRNGEK